MGGGSTRSPKTSDLLRANLLREAFRRGKPALSLPSTSVQFAPVAGPASEQLEVQAIYLEQLLESVPEATCIVNLRNEITRVNGEFSRLFGFTREEAIGQRIDALIVPLDCQCETRWITEALARGQRPSIETRRRRKDGVVIDVSLSAAPVVIDGRHAASHILYRDISGLKRTEALNAALYRIAEKASSVQELQGFYAAIHAIVGELMNARNFYIALYDPVSQFLNFPYFVDEHQRQPAPAKAGRGLTEYVLRSGEPLLVTPHIFNELIERREIVPVVAPSVDWLGVPLKAGGQTFGVVVVQTYDARYRLFERDKEVLTFVSQQLAPAIEHKRQEDALRRSEARYRSLVQSAVYGIFSLDRNSRLLDVNPALVSLLGCRSADEMRALDFRHEVFVDPQEHDALMQDFAAASNLQNIRVRWKRSDGRQITVRLSGCVVERKEEGDQVLEMMAEDITETQALEEQFRQAQKMEAVGRLAGGTAHDFNNLLTVIGGYSEVLLGEDGLGPELREKIEAIRQAADRATALTRQLLAFSRKQVLEPKVVNLSTIVSDMERLLRPMVGENIGLETRLEPYLGCTRADAGQMGQVIMNLVVNAKDAMPQGGKITLRTANVTADDDLYRQLGCPSGTHYVLLSVSDTGIGMDEETRSRIFEPFFTTKEKGKGTGLGLSTVYGIVKQSGGHVLTESGPGCGATFRIYLPRLQDTADQESSMRAAAGPAPGSETVLLVEDEESVRKLVRRTLEARGYIVLEASHGGAALEIAANHSGPIHMLITDMVMPQMSGTELAGHISRTHPTTRVLYLSGYAEDAVIHQSGLQPGTAFLQKPFTLNMLTRKVREVLEVPLF